MRTFEDITIYDGPLDLPSIRQWKFEHPHVYSIGLTAKRYNQFEGELGPLHRFVRTEWPLHFEAVQAGPSELETVFVLVDDAGKAVLRRDRGTVVPRTGKAAQ